MKETFGSFYRRQPFPLPVSASRLQKYVVLSSVSSMVSSRQKLASRLRFLARIGWCGVRDFFTVNGLFLSAGLSFYVLIYCFPLLLLFVSAVGYALSSQRAMEAVEGLLGQLLPTSGLMAIASLEALVYQRELLGGIGVVSFLLFGTFLFDAARYVLNVVFEVTQQRPLWKAFGADVMVMFAMGVLLGVTIVLTSVLEVTRDYGSSVAWIAPLIESGWVVVGRVVGFGLSGAVLYLLYRVAPAKKLSRRTLVASAFTGACLLEISKWLFGLYMDQAKDFTVFYGALSGLIFFVLWIYYASTMFTLAASLGHAYEKAQLSMRQP